LTDELLNQDVFRTSINTRRPQRLDNILDEKWTRQYHYATLGRRFHSASYTKWICNMLH